MRIWREHHHRSFNPSAPLQRWSFITRMCAGCDGMSWATAGLTCVTLQLFSSLIVGARPTTTHRQTHKFNVNQLHARTQITSGNTVRRSAGTWSLVWLNGIALSHMSRKRARRVRCAATVLDTRQQTLAFIQVSLYRTWFAQCQRARNGLNGPGTASAVWFVIDIARGMRRQNEMRACAVDVIQICAAPEIRQSRFGWTLLRLRRCRAVFVMPTDTYHTYWSAYRITSRSQWSKCGVTLAVHDLPSTLSPRPERSTSDWIWNLCEAFRSIGRHAGDWVWVCVVLDWDRGHTRGEKGDMKTKYRRHEVFFGFTLGHWTFNTNISN